MGDIGTGRSPTTCAGSRRWQVEMVLGWDRETQMPPKGA